MARASTKSETPPAARPEIALKSSAPFPHAILLVEDEDFVRNVTCEVLRHAGYEVFTARNAGEAARIFAEWKDSVALLIADVVLPGRTGRHLARELRALQPELKVILTSGYPQGRLVVPDSEAGELLYLEKPFSLEALIRKVWLALHGKWAEAPQAGMAKSMSGH